MTQFFFPFTSIDGDRRYNAKDFATYFRSIFTDGVIATVKDKLRVSQNEQVGMQVVVNAGAAFIHGHLYLLGEPLTVDVTPGNSTGDRVDSIVLQLDHLERDMKILYKQNSTNVQRDENYWELQLATINVPRNATQVLNSQINDKRANESVAGYSKLQGNLDVEGMEQHYESLLQQLSSDMTAWVSDKKIDFQGDWDKWFTTTQNTLGKLVTDMQSWSTDKQADFQSDWDSWFDDIKGRLSGDAAANLAGQIQGLDTDLTNHVEASVMTKEVHDIRVRDKSFQYFDGVDWVTVNEGFKLGNVENMKVEAKAGLKIEVSFGDPADSTVIDDNGDRIVLAKRAGTTLRAKKNSYPVDEKDGDLIVDYATKDKYKTVPYVFDNLINGDEWFFMAFPYSENGVYTIDPANRGKATATNKLYRTPPKAPAVTEVKFDRVKVTGDSGSVVSINKTDWFASPHVFVGLTEETSYTAYAKFEENITHLESPISPGKEFTTPSDLPGPSDLIAGDMQAGYFGVVPASELFTGAEISAATGISNGTLQFNDVGWLKFAIDGKIIYKSQKPYRHTISWDNINAKGCVDGTKQITKDGTTFKVRLMKGALTDPGNYTASDRGAKGSEWNRLMLPIHVKAKDKSWAYPAYVESTIPYWGIDFTDADLQTHSSHGNGSYQWCQEVRSDSASNRVIRGYDGVSFLTSNTSSTANVYYGWSPVLEVVQ